MKTFVLIFGGLGGLLLLIAGILYFREQSFLKTAEVVTGTVTDFDISTDSDTNSNTYCPVILFSTKEGQKVEYHANFCSSPRAYDIGDSVEVIYDPAKPKDVQLASLWTEYLGSLVLTCIGLPLFLVGVGAPVLARPKDKPKAKK